MADKYDCSSKTRLIFNCKTLKLGLQLSLRQLEMEDFATRFMAFKIKAMAP